MDLRVETVAESPFASADAAIVRPQGSRGLDYKPLMQLHTYLSYAFRYYLLSNTFADALIARYCYLDDVVSRRTLPH